MNSVSSSHTLPLSATPPRPHPAPTPGLLAGRAVRLLQLDAALSVAQAAGWALIPVACLLASVAAPYFASYLGLCLAGSFALDLAAASAGAFSWSLFERSSSRWQEVQRTWQLAQTLPPSGLLDEAQIAAAISSLSNRQSAQWLPDLNARQLQAALAFGRPRQTVDLLWRLTREQLMALAPGLSAAAEALQTRLESFGHQAMRASAFMTELQQWQREVSQYRQCLRFVGGRSDLSPDEREEWARLSDAYATLQRDGRRILYTELTRRREPVREPVLQRLKTLMGYPTLQYTLREIEFRKIQPRRLEQCGLVDSDEMQSGAVRTGGGLNRLLIRSGLTALLGDSLEAERWLSQHGYSDDDQESADSEELFQKVAVEEIAARFSLPHKKKAVCRALKERGMRLETVISEAFRNRALFPAEWIMGWGDWKSCLAARILCRQAGLERPHAALQAMGVRWHENLMQLSLDDILANAVV